VIGAFSFWSVLALASSLLFIAGAWGLAVWAAKQHDSQSELIERLTGKQKRSVEKQPDVREPESAEDQ
jgi:hypothetical protein